ncbi:hypothetical protein M434DRAFT_397485 [Hypoxylon sp. CO27-5]|nr:hypothetical protein M434DRAFT_397485 [Hypoxylon sp. CO27-5]
MLVAIAGLGAVARYLIEELPKEGHEVVGLTRSKKSWLDEIVPQRVTDYSAAGLDKQLEDCDAVVSTITGHSPTFLDDHLALLGACQRSSKCKRFLPSSWSGNYEEVTDQPLFVGPQLEILLEKLRGQSDVNWSYFCQGWMVDYILPRQQRYLEDLGERWVQDYSTKTFTLYGNQRQEVDFTSSRDAARAVAVLLNHDAKDWEEFTCVSGQRMSWYQLWEFVKKHDLEYKLKKKSLAQSIKQLIANENEASVAAAMYEIMGNSEALAFPPGKVNRHREKFFKGLKFRTLDELVAEAKVNPTRVI